MIKNTAAGRFLSLIMVVSLLSIISTSLAGAWHGWRGSDGHGCGGWGMQSRYQRHYDPSTIETCTGKVVSVEQITPIEGMCYGIHCILKTGKETLSVHLGPGWFIERLDDPIIPGDVIEVTGSRITVQGQPAIIATRIKKGAALLILRNDLGIPAWSGWQDTIERKDVGEKVEEQLLNTYTIKK